MSLPASMSPAAATDRAGDAGDSGSEYLFGFGSIMNTATHAPWISAEGAPPSLPGVAVRLKRSFGYRRSWNFRSGTGFTALGIESCGDGPAPEGGGGPSTAINGVLFRVSLPMMEGFDRREVGYDKVPIDPGDLELIQSSGGREGVEGFDIPTRGNRIWVYVPQPHCCSEADESHPLLQSYVDTVMQGCLEWGGEAMATEFVSTTSGWSRYFLNDTPSSRRPWLFRREYDTIDRILREHSAMTHFADRRHPEEFASAFLLKMMRGMWSTPQRNSAFTGRDVELGRIHAELTERRMGSSISTLSVAGMGGVGKTQLSCEYCYRYFPSYYGLVIWLNAEVAETVTAGYRRLLADTTGLDVRDMDADEVVSEVRARLFRSKVPWLLVFDNLEDRSLLDKFVPNGGTLGHVLATTRLVDGVGEGTLVLGCFSESESVELLSRSAGPHNISGEGNRRDATELAGRLGHLPLALGMAAAYMHRCDVACSEYLVRYMASEKDGSLLLGHQAGKLVDYPLGVASSLSLSLNAINREDPAAWEMLRLLCWLGPDQITKALLRSLLRAENAVNQEAETSRYFDGVAWYGSPSFRLALLSLGVIGISFQSLLGCRLRKPGLRMSALGMLSLSAAAALGLLVKNEKRLSESVAAVPASAFSAQDFEQTDVIWKILKSYTVLTIKDGKGSMHRLLAQALRASQSEQEGRRKVDICIQGVKSLWRFKPEQVDTWSESVNILEHVKAIASHAFEQGSALRLETGVLCKEAGVLSAMALNRFKEAEYSLNLSLKILAGADRGISGCAHASALHELGRVYRYQGNLCESERALREALRIRNRLSGKNPAAKQGVADTLHELGVLEVKKHNLDSAESFLRKALELRRSLGDNSALGDIKADCAATLHQLATVQVARKPPFLEKAEALLREALSLSIQIGQRAATLKQLARVTIRQGQLNKAEILLAQALELYIELYGKESTLHINVAAVRFQQGALAFQREHLDEAWLHFSECLRIRRHVYAYACPIQADGAARDQSNPVHLDISSVLHELGCVAFAQQRLSLAFDTFRAEKALLERLNETSTQSEHLWQTRLTNLTW